MKGKEGKIKEKERSVERKKQRVYVVFQRTQQNRKCKSKNITNLIWYYYHMYLPPDKARLSVGIITSWVSTGLTASSFWATNRVKKKKRKWGKEKKRERERIIKNRKM